MAELEGVDRAGEAVAPVIAARTRVRAVRRQRPPGGRHVFFFHFTVCRAPSLVAGSRWAGLDAKDFGALGTSQLRSVSLMSHAAATW